MGLLDKFTPRVRLAARIGIWLLAVVVIWVAVAVFSAWRPFTSAEGGFRVEFPGIALTQQQSVPTQLGTVTLNAYTVVQVLHGSQYAVSYAIYPPRLVEQMGSSPLGMMRDTLVNQTGGKVLAERDITEPAPGKEIRLDAPGLGIVRIRVMTVEDRVYALMVSPVPKRGGDVRADRFFKSFTLLSQ
jgi:hypothetical protein